MNRWEKMMVEIGSDQAKRTLSALYGAGDDILRFQTTRYTNLIREHRKHFGDQGTIRLISAPGRCEIGGNHTDHNHGRVLAAAVNLDILCAVTPRDDMTVRFHSEGHRPIEINLNALNPNPKEYGTTAGLIRGVASGMQKAGYRIGGFDAAVTSTVARGSGLSSSAALEVMLTGVLDALYNRFDMPYTLRAQIGQKAENDFFGKPSGLLDQMASAAGGLVTVDFLDTDKPQVRALQYDFREKGYALVVVGTGGSHADLTSDYAAIPAEMKQVASCYGKPFLRGLTVEQLASDIDRMRKKVSDRALIRAFHFLTEDARVPEQVRALEEDRLDDFFRLIIDSGRSSFMYLQNVFAPGGDQSLSLALCIAGGMLRGKGAWRVHGGGFAGTTLNFVPLDMLDSFTGIMNRAFGEGAAVPLNIRPCGVAELKL